MNELKLAVLFGAEIAVSWILTRWIRRYALHTGLMDVPNHRSSHSVPTPRGGGLAFVATFSAALLILWGYYGDLGLLTGLLLGGWLISLVGWCDDRFNLSAGVRLLVHVSVAGLMVVYLGGLPRITLGVVEIHLGIWGSLLAVLGISWAVNLFNFMDGIDGLAATQAVVVGFSGGVFLLIAGDFELGVISLALAAAISGFLILNWHPAKIFMGDVGSGFLGFVFGALALASEKRGSLPLLVWVVLLSPFVMDATATLVYRVLRGEKWHAAHRSHAYQKAVASGIAHSSVTLGILGVDVVLTGIAACTVYWRWALLPSLMLAFLGVFLLWLRYFRRVPPVARQFEAS